MDLGIQGRKAIVCASSQGLGKACALALAQAGVAVIINGRSRERLKRARRRRFAPRVCRASRSRGCGFAHHRRGNALLAACPPPIS